MDNRSPSAVTAANGVAPVEWLEGKPILSDRFGQSPAYLSVQEASFLGADEIKLVSHTQQNSNVRITGLNEQAVVSWSDVLQLSNRLPAHESFQIDYRDPSGQSFVDDTATVTAGEVWSFIAGHLDDGHAVQWQHDKTNRITFIQGDVITTVWMRMIGKIGIYQVYIEMRHVGDKPVLCPIECRARLGERDLNCFTADETLAAIYKRQPVTFAGTATHKLDRCSFMEVAESDGYLDVAPDAGPITTDSRQPTFIAPFLKYPGPAHRGDAIALAGSLLSPDWLEPGDRRDGWIIFGDTEVIPSEPHQVVLMLNVAGEARELTFLFKVQPDGSE